MAEKKQRNTRKKTVVENVESVQETKLQEKSQQKQQPKKLSKASLNKLDKELFPIKKIIVKVENESFNVGVYEKFRKSQVENVVKDVIWINTECENNGIDMDIFTSGLLAILKNLTDIQFSNVDVMENIEMFIKLSNLGILEQIFDAFDKTEIDKLNNSIVEMNKNLPGAIKMMESMVGEQLDHQLVGQLEKGVLPKSVN